MFSWKFSMVQFLCVCILLREKSSSHVGGLWFWLQKKIIDDCCNFVLKITSYFLDRLENAYFLSCYRIKFMFWIYFGSKIKNILSWFFLSLPRRFFCFSSIFHLQKEIIFVFWPFLAPDIASHPEHKSFVFLNMLVWLMKISFLQKLKSTDYPFWVQNTS